MCISALRVSKLPELAPAHRSFRLFAGGRQVQPASLPGSQRCTCKANEQGLRTSAGGHSPLAAGTRFGDREADPVCTAGAKTALPAATKAEVFKRSQKPVPKITEGLHDGPRRCLNAARPRLRFSNRHSTAALIFACSPWLPAIGQGAGPVPPWQDADSPVCG